MRQCEDWLSTLNEYVEDTETPRHFWLWSGIFCIVSALQRKVYIPFGMESIYPNLYVMLVAAPGECRKSPPLKFANRILTDIEIPMFVDSPTKRAMTMALAELSKNCWYKDKAGKLKTQSPLVIISKEFSSFLATDPKGMVEALTDLYDAHDYWEYQTAGKGKDKIHNLCINCIIGSTPTWIANNLPEEAIGGGFTSRFVIVFGDVKYKWISYPEIPSEDIYAKLKKDLLHIANLEGTFRWSGEAFKYYDDWYNSLEKKARELKDERLKGFLSRIHAMAIKTSMALHVAYSDDLVIEYQDISGAVDMLNSVLDFAPDAFGGQGKGRTAPDIERIFKQLKVYDAVRYDELLELNYRYVSKTDFDEILDTLESMKRIKRVYDATNNDTIIERIDYPKGHGKLKE